MGKPQRVKKSLKRSREDMESTKEMRTDADSQQQLDGPSQPKKRRIEFEGTPCVNLEQQATFVDRMLRVALLLQAKDMMGSFDLLLQAVDEAEEERERMLQD